MRLPTKEVVSGSVAAAINSDTTVQDARTAYNDAVRATHPMWQRLQRLPVPMLLPRITRC
jgi:hypothetical protein